MDLLGGLVLGVMWLLFAVVSSLVAPSLGRSRIAWFALGLVFGPFAFLALGAVPALRREVEDPASLEMTQDAEQRWPR